MTAALAARIGDLTSHGGAVAGPGVANVLIGGLPASVLGDLHICPMVTPGVPPVPHVGGPVLSGGVTVLIGGRPAARVGDAAQCVGPVAVIATGCPTVLIGGGAASGSKAPALSSSRAGKEKAPWRIEHLRILDAEGREPAEVLVGDAIALAAEVTCGPVEAEVSIHVRVDRSSGCPAAPMTPRGRTHVLAGRIHRRRLRVEVTADWEPLELRGKLTFAVELNGRMSASSPSVPYLKPWIFSR